MDSDTWACSIMFENVAYHGATGKGPKSATGILKHCLQQRFSEAPHATEGREWDC